MTARLYHFAMFLVTLGMLAGVVADWHFTVGFDPRSLEWWQWLYAAAIHPAGLPDNMQYPALVILGSGMLVLIVLAIFSARARNDTVSGNRKGRELHGSARWANWRELYSLQFVGKQTAGQLLMPIGESTGWLTILFQ